MKETDIISDLLEKDFEQYEMETLAKKSNSLKIPANRTIKVPAYNMVTDESIKEKAKQLNGTKENKILEMKIKMRRNNIKLADLAFVLERHPTTVSHWFSVALFPRYKDVIDKAIESIIEARQSGN